MKILLLNGSPRPNGNTAAALDEMEAVFAAEGLETERVQVGNRVIRGCIACGKVRRAGPVRVRRSGERAGPQAGGLRRAGGGQPGVLRLGQRHPGGPADPAVLLHPFDKTMKVGAAVAAARRGGLSSTFDELNKFFTISGMPVASSQYWNSIHGRLPGEAAQDAEGLQTMRTLARNMAFLVKSIALGREKYGLPEREEPLRTHFIR